MGILDLLFPKKCLDCGIEGKYICEMCVKKVPVNRWQEDNYSIFAYQGVIRKAIIALKYKFATEVAKELAEICSLKLNFSNFGPKTILVPIPMHWRKQNLRGFNQAEIVGKLLAEKMHWQFEPNLLVKTSSTIPQVGLKGPSRQSNLVGAFIINPKTKRDYRTEFVLFDDVYTTGSTIKEARKVLEMAGFKKIQALTIAR